MARHWYGETWPTVSSPTWAGCLESFEKKAGNDTLLNPKLDSLIDILTNIINKSDEMKLKRSNFVRKNFSWENVTNQLKKEFENKLSK